MTDREAFTTSEYINELENDDPRYENVLATVRRIGGETKIEIENLETGTKHLCASATEAMRYAEQSASELANRVIPDE